MHLGKKALRTGVVLAAGLVAFAAPASGQRQTLTMLDQLDRGRWELRLRQDGHAVERLCVSNGRRFIQLRHPETECDRFVVEDGPNAVTVQDRKSTRLNSSHRL